MVQELLRNYNNEFDLKRSEAKYLQSEIQKKISVVSKLNKEILELEDKERNIDYPSILKNIIDPLAESIKNKISADSYLIKGPFGMAREFYIQWFDNSKLEVFNLIIIPGAVNESTFKYKVELEKYSDLSLIDLKKVISEDGKTYYIDSVPDNIEDIIKNLKI